MFMSKRTFNPNENDARGEIPEPGNSIKIDLRQQLKFQNIQTLTSQDSVVER